MTRAGETLADAMITRMREGGAHDDAMLMLRSSIDQCRARTRGTEWPHDLFVAQAGVLVNDGEGMTIESLARANAAMLDLASWAAVALITLCDATGYDLDGLVEGMALCRPPYDRR